MPPKKTTASANPSFVSLSGVPTPKLPVNPRRMGMPSLDSIDSKLTLSSAAAPAGKYTVIRTKEIDSYETKGPVPVGFALEPAKLAVPTGDSFKGTARKAAKLSIANAHTEPFADLRDLVDSLVADDQMIDHDPEIKTTSTSKRVSEENRNIRVKAFIYAASREDDNDFHLIVGREAEHTSEELYMTMELSGLPPQSSKAFAKLKGARDAYKNFFGSDLPGMTYDFYDPPVPVEIEGSLFFDMNHASGQRPGPPSLKSRMPTIWEVHPISKIVFEP